MLIISYPIDPKTKYSPVRKEINKIKNTNHQIKIYSTINYVAKNDGLVDGHITKTIRGEKFLEIRIKSSRDLYRIMYCVIKKKRLVLFYMFKKKEGEKTDQKHIDKARNNYFKYII